MTILVDAHVLVWALYEPEKLSAAAHELLEDEENILLVSDATLWELLNKIGRGKLAVAGSSPARTYDRIRELGVRFVAVDRADILTASTLPHHHSDPFDRMLIAQAMRLCFRF